MSDVKDTLLSVAYGVLEREGAAALTTRRVCEEAGVTMPTLYHHFGNRDGLLSAVHAVALEKFMAKKRALAQTADPVADLRSGCEQVLEFAIAHPGVTVAVMARAVEQPPMLSQAYALMRYRVECCAKHGALRVPIEQAAEHVWAVTQGLVLSIVASPAGTPPSRQSTQAALDALFGALVQRDPPTDRRRRQ
jgi:AcrR family transcriptional regulator